MRSLIALFALLSVAGTSCCANSAPHYAVKPVTGYVTIDDDQGTNCVLPILLPATVADSVWVRNVWWQSGGVLKSDSLRVARLTWVVAQPPLWIPSASEVSTVWWVRDVGGTSCAATFRQIPSQVLVKPAALTGLAVVP
jgi:hypothetical protein